jgi:alpha-L-fucosidase
MTRRQALATMAAASRMGRAQDLKPEIASGPFQATRESLAGYAIPDWFRDAKFGIWAHWGPQSSAEYGDWYARNMYIEGSKQYKYHLENYGHPSKVGFKDVIWKWKAERLDPDSLVRMYKKAGAKYFVSMGVHCDNFDMWNSKHHRWNAANMGPKKDIVGMFRKAALREGLRFGVSEHLWGSYNWFATNKGADKQGPYAGVPYDGNDPANFDLYHKPHEVPPKKSPWSEHGNEPVEWKHEWFIRIQDLVDQYHPDLLYTDGAIPFGEWGLSLAAHYYNQSRNWHRGKVDVVYTVKRPADCETGTCVLDLERGVMETMWPRPWQTDTCIGNWHYDKEVKYKTAKTCIDLLVDVVSRNGNLTLNFPLNSAGVLDDAELKILGEITRWMAVNSEAIYATRPWKIFGEGPASNPGSGGRDTLGTTAPFNEKNRKDFTADEVRFTTKGNDLYAFSMGWNPQQTVIGALAPKRGLYQKEIQGVELLGHRGVLKWELKESGLEIRMPETRPCDHAIAFRIS